MRVPSVVLVLLAAGCDAAPKSAPPSAVPLATGAIEAASFASALNVDLAKSTKTASGLYYRDLTSGSGAAVAAGNQVSVHYAGWLTNGTLFDQSQAGREPFTFVPGTGGVIAGWEEGILGMKVGGKRQLIVPASLGYGAAGSGPVPPNAIMVFTVEVVSIR
jgi:FKBP-type peptidyl-prolyl cis-trans isomerase